METTTLLRKATRQQAKLRVGLSGPSGGGKTYSGLLIAKGLASDMSKVAVIDTENGSADLYTQLGDYNVLPLKAPYTPERYIAAINECVKAGMEVIMIDSTSHEWDGKGGCLEINELLGQTKFKGNNWAAWSETTPRHQKFIEAITTCPCHVITTARSKTDTIQTEDKKIKKVGLKEIQREGFEYELTLNFNIDRDRHLAIASKDRTGMFIDLDPFLISEETGKQLLQWANSGVAPLPVADIPADKVPAPERPAVATTTTTPPKPPKQQVPTKQKIAVLLKNLLGADVATYPPEFIKARVKMWTDLELVEENYEEIFSRLEVVYKEQGPAKTPVVAEAVAETAKIDQGDGPEGETTETTKPKRTRAPRKKSTA